MPLEKPNGAAASWGPPILYGIAPLGWGRTAQLGPAIFFGLTFDTINKNQRSSRTQLGPPILCGMNFSLSPGLSSGGLPAIPNFVCYDPVINR